MNRPPSPLTPDAHGVSRGLRAIGIDPRASAPPHPTPKRHPRLTPWASGNQFEEVRSIRRRGTGQPGLGQPSRYETEVVNTFHLEDDGPGDWTDTYFVYAHIAESRSEAVAHVQAADF